MYRIIDSPVGPLTLVTNAADALTGLYLDHQAHLPDATSFGERDDTIAQDVVDQLGEYFAGTRTGFDVRLAASGTEFQHQVWDALREIPYGETDSYGRLAARIGRPAASRAVGVATGRNPISIIVPCHRLLSGSGRLTGYAGGIDKKQYLLDVERGLAPTPSPDWSRPRG